MSRGTTRFAAALGAAVFVCAGEALAGAPAHRADPLNLFVVVEAGDHHVTILDGDRLEPIHRFASRGALCGAPAFAPDARHVFLASCGGWVSKFDLWSLKTVAEVRAGLATSNVAVSSDGKFVAVANDDPHTLVVLDAGLQPVKILEARDLAKQHSSRVSAVHDVPQRRSFVAALADMKELWEVSYDPAAPEIAQGLVHDYRLREGTFISGFLNPRRSLLEEAIETFRLLPDGRRLVGAARGARTAQLIHLDVRRRIATVDLDAPLGPEHPDSLDAIDRRGLEFAARLRLEPPKPSDNIAFDRHGRYVLASLPEADDALIVYDTSTLKEVKRLSMRKPVGKYNVFNEIARQTGSSH